MASLPVDTLNFTFSAAIANAQLYDQWIHYTTVFNAPPGGKKAIDVVAVEAGVAPATTWMKKYGAIHLLIDSVSVFTVLVYTHGFRSLSAGSARTLVIARATGQRHAAVTGRSFAPWRDNFIAAG